MGDKPYTGLHSMQDQLRLIIYGRVELTTCLKKIALVFSYLVNSDNLSENDH
jgi:hypothetical protein